MSAADSVYAYANSLQRTVATAQFFITGAFPGCDVPASSGKMGTMDPTFNPVITDNSPEFREKRSGDGVRAAENAAGRKLQAAGADDELRRFAVLQREKTARWRTRKIPSAPTMKKSRAYPGR
jgi:hypothetical protein